MPRRGMLLRLVKRILTIVSVVLIVLVSSRFASGTTWPRNVDITANTTFSSDDACPDNFWIPGTYDPNHDATLTSCVNNGKWVGSVSEPTENSGDGGFAGSFVCEGGTHELLNTSTHCTSPFQYSPSKSPANHIIIRVQGKVTDSGNFPFKSLPQVNFGVWMWFDYVQGSCEFDPSHPDDCYKTVELSFFLRYQGATSGIPVGKIWDRPRDTDNNGHYDYMHREVFYAQNPIGTSFDYTIDVTPYLTSLPFVMIPGGWKSSWMGSYVEGSGSRGTMEVYMLWFYGQDSAPPQAPALTASQVCKNNVILDWTDEPAGDFYKYTIHKSTTSGFVPSDANKVATKYWAYPGEAGVGGLVGGTWYYFKVVTVDEYGSTATSNELAILTPPSGCQV